MVDEPTGKFHPIALLGDVNPSFIARRARGYEESDPKTPIRQAIHALDRALGPRSR
jgi:hypothetical protein